MCVYMCVMFLVCDSFKERVMEGTILRGGEKFNKSLSDDNGGKMYVFFFDRRSISP